MNFNQKFKDFDVGVKIYHVHAYVVLGCGRRSPTKKKGPNKHGLDIHPELGNEVQYCSIALGDSEMKMKIKLQFLGPVCFSSRELQW